MGTGHKCSPYTKLALAIVLQGLMERDQSLITTVTRRNTAEDLKSKKFHKARLATVFVNSKQFDEWCNRADLDPTVARKLEPKKAKLELRRLMDTREIA